MLSCLCYISLAQVLDNHIQLILCAISVHVYQILTDIIYVQYHSTYVRYRIFLPSIIGISPENPYQSGPTVNSFFSDRLLNNSKELLYNHIRQKKSQIRKPLEIPSWSSKNNLHDLWFSKPQSVNVLLICFCWLINLLIIYLLPKHDSPRPPDITVKFQLSNRKKTFSKLCRGKASISKCTSSKRLCGRPEGSDWLVSSILRVQFSKIQHVQVISELQRWPAHLLSVIVCVYISNLWCSAVASSATYQKTLDCTRSL